MSTRKNTSVQEAYAYCIRLARTHYENFPVASLLIPGSLRPAVASIYAFARTADDFADEGARTTDQRLRLLDEWEVKLDRCYRGDADDPVFVALGETVARFGIPRQLLSDLLVAFRMDVTKKRYATFKDLLGYCRCSANPVGRLVLHIFRAASEESCPLSDAMCTALQLANFWQDISVDWRKGRLYVPLEDVDRFGYTEKDFSQGVCDERFRGLMGFEIGRTRGLFARGKALIDQVPRSLRLELKLTWFGGMRVLENIERNEYDVLNRRPALSTTDKLGILVRGIFFRPA